MFSSNGLTLTFDGIIINFLTDKKAPPRQSDGRRSVKNRVDQTRDFFSLTNLLGLTRSMIYAMFWRTPVGLTNSLALAIYYQRITFILIHHDDDTIYSNNMNSSISCNVVSVQDTPEEDWTQQLRTERRGFCAGLDLDATAHDVNIHDISRHESFTTCGWAVILEIIRYRQTSLLLMILRWLRGGSSTIV